MPRPSSFSFTANANVNTANLNAMLCNPENWKKTRKNSYSIWATITQPGVTIYNSLEDADYETDEQFCVVLSGTRGEKWITTLDKFAKKYYFSSSVDESLPKKPINPSLSNSAMIDASQPITKKAIMARGKKVNGTLLLPWTSVTTIPRGTAYTNYCFHLPLSVKNFPVKTADGETLIANREGIAHAVGDFILCSMTPDGLPNLRDVWVVNGEVFLDTYNKVNVKGLPKSEDSNTAPKPDEEYAALPKKISTDESGNITGLGTESSTSKSGGAPRNSYKLIAKYTKNGKSFIAFGIEELATKKVQVVDKAALYWLIGRGQIEGLTVQIRGAKIGLLAKDGFSLDSVETKTV